MQMKKIISCVAAAAMAVSALGVSVSADAPYTAKIGFSDMSWAHQDWDASVEVTGDGTYTITSTALAGAEDFGVFVIDIEGMYAGDPDASAVLDKIEVDGSELSFDASKIIYGDIEEKGNFRIEIFNQYGDSIKDPGVNSATPAEESIAITFTVSGLDGAAEEAVEEAAPVEETAPAPDTTTTPATTGNAPAASVAVVMVAAAAAAAVSKKK